MSVGAISAGIDVALAVEADAHAAGTYAFNHPSTPLFLGDIRRLSGSHLRTLKRGREGTIIFGGSPCQGFSYSNQRTRNRRNAHNWLYLEFVRIARLWEPDWVVFENVQGMKETEQGLFFKDLLLRLSDLGYELAHGVLDAADFGVPQHRKRLFVVGSRGGTRPVLPHPCSDHVSVEAAIGDLPILPNGASINWLPYQGSPRSEYSRYLRRRLKRSPNHFVTRNAAYVIERYRHIPQGCNWTSIPPRLMGNYSKVKLDLHTGLYRRLRPDLPSLVIGNYRKNMLIHPYENRGLSVREAARIQSFPDWFEFRGSIGFQQQQVGNAVPPHLAKQVLQGILSLCGLCSRNVGLLS